MWLKPVAEPRAECSIVDCAANLEQEIGTSSGPAHLLRFIHSAVDEKVCGSLSDRRSDPMQEFKRVIAEKDRT